MIITIILYLFGYFISALVYFLVTLSSAMVALPFVDEIFEWLFGSISYFGGVIPVADVFNAIAFLVLFYETLYFLKLLMWLSRMLPFVGRLGYPFGVPLRVREGADDTLTQSTSYRSEGVQFTTSVRERLKKRKPV